MLFCGGILLSPERHQAQVRHLKSRDQRWKLIYEYGWLWKKSSMVWLVASILTLRIHWKIMAWFNVICIKLPSRSTVRRSEKNSRMKHGQMTFCFIYHFNGQVLFYLLIDDIMHRLYVHFIFKNPYHSFFEKLKKK